MPHWWHIRSRSLAMCVLVQYASLALRAWINLGRGQYTIRVSVGWVRGEIGRMNEAAKIYHRGVADWLRGDPDRAMSAFCEAIRLNPAHTPALCDRGTLFCDRQEYGLAVADFCAAIRLDPLYARAYNNRGFAYKQLGDLQHAVADYSEAIRLQPEYTEAYHNRSIAYAEMKQLDKARADLARFNAL